MYLDTIASLIRARIPDDRLPEGDAESLLRFYAVLLRAKGASVTESDVHDAWSAWMMSRNPGHSALVPYPDLDVSVQEQDRTFVSAIRAATEETASATRPARPADFARVLFPCGLPTTDDRHREAFELYKLMVQSSEALVNRRQAVNTFFLTMNGALLTAIGLIVQNHSVIRLAALAILVLAVAGALLCGAWHSLLRSFGQLNTGKFKVINSLETQLSAAIYAAEWEALERGRNPKVYRSFTSREMWVPRALLALHLLTALAAAFAVYGKLPVPLP
ncbi:MAG TPA: hypothetical protein VGJ81_16600 [Thermoanaerobaculia bacterium]|jgi:hypothetical protein